MERELSVKIYFVLVGSDFSYAPGALSPARALKIAQMKSPRARAQSAAADIALDFALREHLPNYIPPPMLTYAPGGQPEVPGAHISISHTEGLAACAIANAPVGLDIERADRVLDEKLAPKVLSQEEMEHLPACPDAQELLLRTWVAKEAYLKLTGEGLAGGMQRYTIAGSRILDLQGVPRAHLVRTELTGYHIAVCCHLPFTIKTMFVPI